MVERLLGTVAVRVSMVVVRGREVTARQLDA
jgi:hypothetical protein